MGPTENAEAPQFPEPNQTELAERLETMTKRAEHSDLLEDTKLKPRDEELAGFVSYVTYKKYANVTFLVKPGKPVKAPIQAGTPMGLTPISHREGDVFVRFVNSVATTNDKTAIAWCEEHPDVCRRASDPRTRAWEALKSAQTVLATREALIDGGMNVDELMFGDRDPSQLGDAVLANSEEDDVVAAALASESKANKDSTKEEKLIP